jgi:hypothetical protein
MKKGTKLLLGGVTVAAAAVGAIGAVIMKRDRKSKRGRAPDSWARPGMKVTFRAELMPGRDPDERTYEVTDLLPSGRVLLDRVNGEHTQTEFERQ